MSRTLTALLAVLATGVLAFAGLTRGFTVLTAEAARRQAVAESPIRIPVLMGTDQQGNQRPLFDGLDGLDSRVVIVDFIFTRCTSVCSALGSSYQQLQAEITEEHLDGAVRLATVSFDPEHDTPAIVADYGARLHANPALWTILTPLDTDALHRSLKIFGVVVMPAADGQFIHNAAFHVIDRHGRLARIIDIAQPREALAATRRLYDAP